MCKYDCHACEKQGSPRSNGFDLKGQCILFVGGRKQHVSHARRLVEGACGKFVCHDGGVEESMERLYSLFNRADVVVFPVDCISHAAQTEVKRFCRRLEKPFVPMRRSGISAFVQALEAIADGMSTAVDAV